MTTKTRTSSPEREQEGYSMTTQVRNSSFTQEVEAFMRPVFPSNPLPFVYALADGLRSKGAAFIQTDDAKALLHILMSQSHGKGYQVDGYKEHQRLIAVFRG